MTITEPTDHANRTLIEDYYGMRGLAVERTLYLKPFMSFTEISKQHNITKRKVSEIAELCNQTKVKRRKYAIKLLTEELNYKPDIKAIASKYNITYNRVERVYLQLKKEREIKSLEPYKLPQLMIHKETIERSLQIRPYAYRTLADKYHLSPIKMYLHLRATGFYKKGYNVPTVNIILDYRYHHNETVGKIASETKTDISLVTRICRDFKTYLTTPQLERQLS